MSAPGVHAQESTATIYETQGAHKALAQRGRRLDHAPEGKRIAFIDVARDEVFVEDEIALPIVLPRQAPTWPNALHWLTEEEVVRRELLFVVGSAYERARVEESERNLRGLAVFSLVRIVAVQAPEPGTVGVLVYTRDLWSLRTETAFVGAGDAYRLQAQIVERNLLGRDKTLTLRSGLEPQSISAGQVFYDPRVFGSELQLSQSVDVVFNRERGVLEGSYGELQLGRPQRDLRQRWSWGALAKYHDYVARTPRGQGVAGYRRVEGGAVVSCAPDVATDGLELPTDCVRAVWDDQGQTFSVGVGYHRGLRYTQSFGLGVGYSDRAVASNAETMLRPEQRETFERFVLPRVRRQVYPSFSYSVSTPEYESFHDLGTFGQSEAVRVGPDASFGVSAPLRAFGSSTDAVRFSSGVGYVLADGRGLFEAALGASTRLEDGEAVDQSLGAVVRSATPPFLAGRLVAYASWSGHRRDTSNASVALGGDSGLRGYESAAFLAIGAERLRCNFEYRTLPLVIASVHIGGVLFYDAGSVYTALSSAELHHSVGAGVRVLLPQINRTPFGIDVGVPLGGEGVGVLLTYASEQTVPLTAFDDALAASGP